MSMQRWFVAFLSVTAIVTPSRAETKTVARAALAENPKVAAALTVLDAWINATVAEREQPGLSIGIVYDQDLIWAKGYGFADLESKMPATPATRYRIASITKLFTSTAIMQLRDAGKLSLDDPVQARLSWFSIKRAPDDTLPITIRQLISHTSGLPREALGVNWSDLTYPDADEFPETVPQQEAIFPAGAEWKYSNLGLTLAGEIVAAVSGEPWGQYIQSQIFEPLGMTASRTKPEEGMPGFATGYGRRVPGQPRDIEPLFRLAESPAGSIVSNVEDLAKFASLQFRDGPVGGSQILKGTTIAEMHRIEWLRPDWKSGWGLGFSLRRVDDQTRIGHGGSLPGHRCQIQMIPAQKIGVIALTNANDGDPSHYVNQAFTLVAPALVSATRKPKEAAKADPEWEKYVGTYTWKHSDMQIVILDGELAIIYPGADNPWESRMLLKPAGRHAFRMVSPDFTSGPIGETLTFDVNEAGKATRARTPNYYWVRK